MKHGLIRRPKKVPPLRFGPSTATLRAAQPRPTPSSTADRPRRRTPTAAPPSTTPSPSHQGNNNAYYRPGGRSRGRGRSRNRGRGNRYRPDCWTDDGRAPLSPPTTAEDQPVPRHQQPYRHPRQFSQTGSNNHRAETTHTRPCLWQEPWGPIE